METGNQMLSQQKRETKAKDLQVRLILRTDFSYYDILNTSGDVTNIGRIESTPSLNEYCTCQDFIYRNNKFYEDEHGFVLQCKHIIAAKKARGWEDKE